MGEKPLVYAVSDATGELAVSLATAAVRQFPEQEVRIIRRAKVTNEDRIVRIVREAQEAGGFIVFTLVAQARRQFLLKAAAEAGVPAVDLMGPVLGQLTEYIHRTPSDQPGLKYQMTKDYLRRNEAIDFTVKHDDGLGLDSLAESDIILLGVSRTSKTPLSIYLATKGFKTANVPIVTGVSLPQEIHSVDRRKLVCLTINPEKLTEVRGTRLAKLGRVPSEDYANLSQVRDEVVYAQRLFAELGQVPVIDVTAKAIEEVASEILTVLGQ